MDCLLTFWELAAELKYGLAKAQFCVDGLCLSHQIGLNNFIVSGVYLSISYREKLAERGNCIELSNVSVSSEFFIL